MGSGWVDGCVLLLRVDDRVRAKGKGNLKEGKGVGWVGLVWVG